MAGTEEKGENNDSRRTTVAALSLLLSLLCRQQTQQKKGRKVCADVRYTSMSVWKHWTGVMMP